MRSRIISPFLFSILVGACGAPPNDNQDDPTTQSHIKAGTPAKDFPAACLLDLYDAQNKLVALCSGAVIAPGVVLTAGHCVSGFATFRVTCPYLAETARGPGEAHPTYHAGPGGAIAADSNDVGLVYLNSRILMTKYPVVRGAAVPDGTLVVNVGRVLDGNVSHTDLYESSAIKVQNGQTIGFPRDYFSEDKIQPGDSGGPTFEGPASNPQIVAVNSGAGDSFAVLTRLDLVYDWIQQKVYQHGGYSVPPGYQQILPEPPKLVPRRP